MRIRTNNVLFFFLQYSVSEQLRHRLNYINGENNVWQCNKTVAEGPPRKLFTARQSKKYNVSEKKKIVVVNNFTSDRSMRSRVVLCKMNAEILVD